MYNGKWTSYTKIFVIWNKPSSLCQKYFQTDHTKVPLNPPLMKSFGILTVCVVEWFRISIVDYESIAYDIVLEIHYIIRVTSCAWTQMGNRGCLSIYSAITSAARLYSMSYNENKIKLPGIKFNFNWVVKLIYYGSVANMCEGDIRCSYLYERPRF